MFKRLDENITDSVSITIDGQSYKVPKGETVAAAILANGIRYTRLTPLSAAPRAPFCLMGVCYECLMVIDGQPNQRACKKQVVEGMVVERQQGVDVLKS